MNRTCSGRNMQGHRCDAVLEEEQYWCSQSCEDSIYGRAPKTGANKTVEEIQQVINGMLARERERRMARDIELAGRLF